jgi:hypothetical protein
VRVFVRAALAAALALSAASAPGSANAAEAASSSWALQFLRDKLGLTTDEAARVSSGEVVARMVDDQGEREIAVLGAARLPGPPKGWGADYDAVARLRRVSPDFIAMGRLGWPPNVSELADLELDPKIAAQLERCVVERCAMNTSRAEIERYGRIDWESPKAVAAANAVFRDALRERMAAYQERGDASMPVLANRRWPLTTADTPRLLLERKPSLAQLAPALDAHFRAGAARGDVYYWHREKIWRREVVGLYQAAFEDERADCGRRRVVAEKLIFANHYLLGQLTVTGVLEDASGAYLFFLNRSETDNHGAFNFIERALANRLIGGRIKRQVPGLRNTAATPPASSERKSP